MNLLKENYKTELDFIKNNLCNDLDNLYLHIMQTINTLICNIIKLHSNHRCLVFLYCLKAFLTNENIYFRKARDIYIKYYNNPKNILVNVIDWKELNLNVNEFEELLSCESVYFTSEKHTKFDIKNSDARYNPKRYDHINFRYEILSNLGKGAFSNVFKCADYASNQNNVAIKIIRNEPRFNKQSKIELNILKQLREINNPYIYNILGYFNFRNHECFVFPLFGMNLYQYAKKNNFSPIKINYVRQISKQLLLALSVLKKNKIIHADLKPENIVIESLDTSKILIKVIDFGSATHLHEKIHTYIQSRYYRAPEIILGLGYDCSIDLWSLGCIIFELIKGYPLFNDKNETSLILSQYNFLGQFEKDFLSKSIRKDILLNQIYNYTQLIPYKKLNILSKNLEINVYIQLRQFLESIFKWKTKERSNIENCLIHNFIIN